MTPPSILTDLLAKPASGGRGPFAFRTDEGAPVPRTRGRGFRGPTAVHPITDAPDRSLKRPSLRRFPAQLAHYRQCAHRSRSSLCDVLVAAGTAIAESVYLTISEIF